MKTTVKFFVVFIFIIFISIFVSRCKSGTGVESFTKTEAIDSVSVTEVEPETPADLAQKEDELEVKDTATLSKHKAIVVQKPLTLVIQNLESATAPVYVSLYGIKNKFPEPKGQMKEYKFKPHGNVLTVQIPNLKFGTYAIASYQDVNSSGKIDKNFIGIPTEGYAFSNNFKPTIAAPDFDDCSFVYNSKNCSVTMKMIQ